MDFKKIIEELQATGLSERQLARLAETSQSSIRNTRDKGGEPRWSTGQAIIELHRVLVEKRYAA